MARTKDDQTDNVVTIKKYANRRLYNTATSSYVTLNHLAEMVKENVEFVVVDAKTTQDITQSVLTQIIVEQESKGSNLLPIRFLRQIIGLYGDTLGGVVPKYLEQSMDMFTQNEVQLRALMRDTFNGTFPIEKLEEIGRSNRALMENTIKILNSFSVPHDSETQQGTENGNTTIDKSEHSDKEIDDLKKQMAAMQQQLNRLTKARY